MNIPPFSNIPSLLIHLANHNLYQKNFFQKKHGQYIGISHAAFCTQVYQLSLQLSQWGINASDKVGIFSSNCSEWVLADMAILSLGAVVVPLYPTLTSEEASYIISDSGCKLVFIKDPAQYQILKNSPIAPQIQIVSFSPIQGLDCIQTDPTDTTHDLPLQWLELIQTVNRDTLASIVYTSGTTGQPKGVELTHGNFLSNVEDLMSIFDINESDSVLSFLPLSHVFERTVGYYALLGFRSTVYYARSIDSVSEDLLDARPTILISVPRVYEKIQARILERLNKFTQPIFNFAFAVARKYRKEMSSEQLSFWSRYLYPLAEFLVIRNIKKKTGGRLRFFVSGGAPLSKELAEWFYTMGLLIIEGYGMTETSPIIACNRLTAFQFGSVGQALPRVETQIAPDGELCVKGPNVMRGYHHLPEQTREIIDNDGWLHTGDIAHIDSNGYIHILDRKKEMIVMSNGKKVPPQKIESLLKQNALVESVMVLGDNRNYLTALIVPNLTRLFKEVPQLSHLALDNLLASSDANNWILHSISKNLDECANYEKIKKITLLPAPFSTETGELTITLKLRRKYILEKYSRHINSMYAEN